MTCVTDVMWTTSMMDDYLNDFEDIIDWVKIQNHRRTISTYDDKWFSKRNKTLAKHNVGSYIGGMVFEMAYVQGKHRQFFEKNLELGFSAIEVSEDSIPDMPPGVRTDIIKEAKIQNCVRKMIGITNSGVTPKTLIKPGALETPIVLKSSP